MLKIAISVHHLLIPLYQPKLWHHNNDMAYTWSKHLNHERLLIPLSFSDQPKRDHILLLSMPWTVNHRLCNFHSCNAPLRLSQQKYQTAWHNHTSPRPTSRLNLQNQSTMNEHNLLGKMSGRNPSPIFISPNALMAMTMIKQSIFNEIYMLGVQKLLQELNSIPLLWQRKLLDYGDSFTFCQIFIAKEKH